MPKDWVWDKFVTGDTLRATRLLTPGLLGVLTPHTGAWDDIEPGVYPLSVLFGDYYAATPAGPRVDTPMRICRFGPELPWNRGPKLLPQTSVESELFRLVFPPEEFATKGPEWGN